MHYMDSRVEQSLTPVVTRWAEQDKDLLLPLFQLVVSGESLAEANLAESLGKGSDEIDAALDTSLAEIDSHGRVTELFGITRDPTLHRIEFGGVTLYSCCALVAHMVPALIGRAVSIDSTDPISGKIIKLKISADSKLQHIDPLTAFGSMVDCTVEEIISSPRSNFCCHVKHFTTSESAGVFANKSSHRYLTTIEDFHEAAQWLHGEIWC